VNTNRLQISGVVPAVLGFLLSFSGVAVSGSPIAVYARNRLYPQSPDNHHAPSLDSLLSNANAGNLSNAQRQRLRNERTHATRRIGQTETIAKSVELLTPSQVCELLKVSESTFFRLVRRMAFPVVHLGKSLRVRRTALETYLAKMES
jgi:excisionase family DNA binding protein